MKNETTVPELKIYEATTERNDWDHPTTAQLVKSANVAHSACRKLETTCNQLRSELLTERQWRRWLVRAIVFVVTTGGATIAFILKFLLPYAIKGMMR